MRRSVLESLVLEKTLNLINTSTNADLVDYLFEHDAATGQAMTKNVCAKVHPSLAEEIDQVTSLLGVSKRQFLEAAFIQALAKARQIIDEEGLYDALQGGE